MGIQLSSVVRNSEVSDIREQKCAASMGIAVGIYIHGDLLYRGDLLLGGGSVISELPLYIHSKE